MKNRFAFLDGIRGLAAIFVLTRHTGTYWEFDFYRSYLAVDLFFILSGFVIAHAYDNKLRNGDITPVSFVKIRLIRFYPVFFFSILLCVAVLFAQATAISWEILFTLALTAFFIPSHAIAGDSELFSVNGPYWSLFYELIINIIYAFMHRWLNNTLLVTIIIISFFTLLAAAYLHQNLNAGFYFSMQSMFAGFTRAIFGIFSGLWLYRSYEVLSQFIGSLISPWFAVFLICALLASPDAQTINWLIDICVVGLVFPLCILIASRPFPTGWEKILLYLGSASYPIYLIHKPFGELVSTLFQGKQALYAPYSGLILLACLLVCSILLEKKYDIPVRRKLSKVLMPINANNFGVPSRTELENDQLSGKLGQLSLVPEYVEYWRGEIADRRFLSDRREAKSERRSFARRHYGRT